MSKMRVQIAAKAGSKKKFDPSDESVKANLGSSSKKAAIKRRLASKR